MSHLVLVTGGAGFIGSHLADELLAHGYRVRVIDNLSPQVHGESTTAPAYLDPAVDLRIGDAGDPEACRAALDGVDGVFHLAAAAGVGQSMYEVAAYTRANNLATAVLLEQLIATPGRKLVVASSMSVYGEGLYRGADGRPREGKRRSRLQLARGRWELVEDGWPLQPVPTPEEKRPDFASVDALSKFDQERMCLLLGETYGFPAVALRFSNTYGPRQALSNPYTGALAIFASRLLNRRRPLVFEDGKQRRDFVNVRDVARACRLAYERSEAAGQAINLGSGRSIAIADLARRMAALLGCDEIEPEITGEHRAGDIRHCFADISKAERLLGFRPAVGLEDGLEELARWLSTQTATDRVATARAELRARGLTVDSAARRHGAPRPVRHRHDERRLGVPSVASARAAAALRPLGGAAAAASARLGAGRDASR